MMKKIGAVLLALVLCLSVAVLPVSAGFDDGYTLADGKRIAYKVELDKASYNAGETVTVKVFLKGDSGVEFHTGSMLFGVNSAVFDTTVNAANTVKATASANDTFSSFYNEITGLNWAWQAAAIKTRIATASTAEENELYNEYLKVVLSRNLSGSHPNAGLNTNGLPAYEVNADAEPFIQFQLKLRDDIADGTPVNVAITSGAIKCKPAQTAFKAFLDGSTKNVSPAVDTYDVSAAVASATVGEVAPAGPVLTKANSQVKMTATSATTVADAFQFRVISSISAADWDAYFANTGKADATANAITKVGFVVYKGTTGFNLDTAKAAVAGTAADGYQVATTDYIQHVDGADAKFGCRIDITSAETRSDVTYVAFAQYLDASGAAQVVFYETSYEALLATNYTGIVAAYLNAFPFAG